MTTATPLWKRQLAHDQLSAIAVTAVTILALLLGWGVKTAVENQTRTVEQAGVTAAVPSGWLVQDGAGDLIFLARNSASFSQLYRVSLLPAASDLAAIAGQQSRRRSQLEPTYRVLAQTPIVVDGRDGYKVSFAFADADDPGMPSVIEGVDYYFLAGDQVLVVSFEAKYENFAGSLPQFHRFLTSVSYEAGG